MTERPMCPDPEALGAFAEGTAAEAEIAHIREHLATCNDCLEEVAEVSRFAVLETPTNVVPLRPASGGLGRGGWLAAAAAVAVALAGLGVWRMQTRDPLEGLRAATQQANDRVVEGRLSSFPFGEYSPKRGEAEASEDRSRIDAAAWQVLAKAGDRNREQAAVANLFVDRVRQAADDLEKLAKEKPADAALWNDLAAAQLQNGDYRRALDTADRARHLDPKLREARFNHALALQNLNAAQAKAEWQQYIATETDPRWAQEAKKNLDLLSDLR